MSKHLKSIFLIAILTFMLVGCDRAAEAEPAAVVEPATAASAAISSAAQATNETATMTAVPATSTAEPATSTAVPATATAVLPTNTPRLTEEPEASATFVLAAKPQLLEFYTEW